MYYLSVKDIFEKEENFFYENSFFKESDFKKYKKVSW